VDLSQSLSSPVIVIVNVLKGDIVLVISGSSEKMLYEDGEVLLDVSGSYDEDEIVNSESSSNSFLLYSYSCVQSEPIYIPFCFLTFNTVSKTPNNIARVSINPSFKSNVTLNSESDCETFLGNRESSGL